MTSVLPTSAGRLSEAQQSTRAEVEPGSGIQSFLAAGPSAFVAEGRREFSALAPRQQENVAVDLLREKYHYLVDAWVRILVEERTAPGAKRKTVDKAIGEIVANCDEHFEEFFAQGKMARSPSGFNRVHLDAFPVVFGDRSKLCSRDPLDDIVLGHGDLSITNLELRKWDHQTVVGVHDFESAALMPRRYEYNKTALGIWFSVMDAPLGERMADAIENAAKKVLLASDMKKDAALNALGAWRKVVAGKAKWEEFADTHAKAAEQVREIERCLRTQRAQQCVASLFASLVKETHALHRDWEREGSIAPAATRLDSLSPKLQEGLPYELRYRGRLEATYLDEDGRFAQKVNKSKREIRALGEHHRGVWIGAVNALEGDLTVTDAVRRQGSGGASLFASIKRFVAGRIGEERVLAQAKSPIPSASYLWPFSVLAKVLPGVPRCFWLDMTHHGQRTIRAREIWQGEHAPDERAMELDGDQFLYARRDPGRTSLDLKYSDTDTVLELAEVLGREMARGHFQSWTKLPFLRREDRDLRSGLDSPSFIEDMVAQAEADAGAMSRLAELASDYTGGKKALKSILRGFAEEAGQGLIGTFHPYERVSAS